MSKTVAAATQPKPKGQRWTTKLVPNVLEVRKRLILGREGERRWRTWPCDGWSRWYYRLHWVSNGRKKNVIGHYYCPRDHRSHTCVPMEVGTERTDKRDKCEEGSCTSKKSCQAKKKINLEWLINPPSPWIFRAMVQSPCTTVCALPPCSMMTISYAAPSKVCECKSQKKPHRRKLRTPRQACLTSDTMVCVGVACCPMCVFIG